MSPPTPYPRSNLKRIVKAHSNLRISKNADVMIYLDYVLFMQQLIHEANVHARAGANGTVTGVGKKKVGITARDVRKVSQVTLRKFKG
ncbi:hypothetical protein C7212DRAFT_326575 [Tuber magnatum]|uniref:Transcription factor CBF/NF-Y/archaeal histone domain-containing protein n=1 Tax=Tuber magnatum TaxID=42249 RepID=A0A317SMF2_9PEZI|nr:hypothetical protein C7212DRAFT_326575 [Tuber magnatum]